VLAQVQLTNECYLMCTTIGILSKFDQTTNKKEAIKQSVTTCQSKVFCQHYRNKLVLNYMLEF